MYVNQAIAIRIAEALADSKPLELQGYQALDAWMETCRQIANSIGLEYLQHVDDNGRIPWDRADFLDLAGYHYGESSTWKHRADSAAIANARVLDSKIKLEIPMNQERYEIVKQQIKLAMHNRRYNLTFSEALKEMSDRFLLTRDEQDYITNRMPTGAL